MQGLTVAVIPLADVLTPNIPEAEKITGSRVSSLADMEEAAKAIHTMGSRAVVVKGGHALGNAVDVLFDGKEICHFDTDRINSEAVEQAVIGGCTMVQLREKEISSLDFYALAVEIKKITDSYGVPLIINDRVDIAMAVGTAGVHIGQKDIPADIARKVIGKDMLLGVSVVSVAEAVNASKAGADYLGVGAMFPTGTKPDARFVSMEELGKIRRAADLKSLFFGKEATNGR